MENGCEKDKILLMSVGELNMGTGLVDRYINIERKKIYGVLYYIAMIIYLPMMLCSISYLQPELGESGMRLLHHARIVAYLILLFIVGDTALRDLLTGLRNKSFLSPGQLVLMLALFISVVSAYISKKSEAFVIMLIIAAAIDVKPDTRKLFALIAAMQFASIPVFWYLTVRGVLPDSQEYAVDLMRHSFGFAYVTFAPMLQLFISMEYIYFRNIRKISLTELGILLDINIVLYKYCKSRNSMLIFTVVFAAALLYKLVPDVIDRVIALLSKFMGLLMALIFAVSFIGPYIFTHFYKGDVSRGLGSIAARFYLSYEAMQRYRVITLFGQKIDWEAPLLSSNKDGYVFVDNAYLHGLLDFGIIYFILMLLIYMVILRIFRQRKEFMNYFMIVMILCLSVIDPRLWVLVFNPFPMLISEGYEEMIAEISAQLKKRGKSSVVSSR